MIPRYGRALMVLIAAAVVWGALSIARPTLRAGDGLAAEYFTNTEWIGPPAFSVVDAAPSTAGMMLPWNGAPPEQFSVRWTGFLTVGHSGEYDFATTSDDGSRLFVDNRLVVDNGGRHGIATRSGSIQLHRGSHAVVLDYVQFGGDSLLDWSWRTPDGREFAVVPAWALSQRPTRYAIVVAARIVEWGLRGAATLVLLAAAWYVGAGPLGQAGARRMGVLWRGATRSYRNAASFLFSVVVFAVILLCPWPDGGPQRFYRAVEGTLRELNGTAIRVLWGGFDTFQADINRPQPAEYVLPFRVQEMLTMLDRHRVARYQMSEAIAADDWVFQQIVASAWPRKLEKGATARFVLNGETVAPGCTLVDRQTEVSLVHCP